MFTTPQVWHGEWRLFSRRHGGHAHLRNCHGERELRDRVRTVHRFGSGFLGADVCVYRRGRPFRIWCQSASLSYIRPRRAVAVLGRSENRQPNRCVSQLLPRTDQETPAPRHCHPVPGCFGVRAAHLRANCWWVGLDCRLREKILVIFERLRINWIEVI